MAKISKEDKWRREGMSYALRIAEEKGIDGLREDLKLRGAINLPIPIDEKLLNEFVYDIKDNVVNSMLILMAATLHDEFGFGEKRVQRAVDRLLFKASCLTGDYVTWNDIIEDVKQELNIELEINYDNFSG